MPYNPIPSETLALLANKIPTYSAEDDASQAFLELLRRCTWPDVKPEVARGLLVLGIDLEISGLSEAMDDLSLNSFDSEQRLMDLYAFYEYLQTAKELPERFWNKKDLLNFTRMLLKNIVKWDTNLSSLKSSIPDNEVLKGYFDDLLAEYKEEEDKRWFDNPDRHATKQFIQLVHKFCHVGEYVATDRKEMDIRLATLLFVATYIHNQYWVLSPGGGLITSGSMLYKECMRLLNVEDISELSVARRVALFNELLEFLYQIPLEDEVIAIIPQKDVQALVEKIGEFRDKLLKQLNIDQTVNQTSTLVASKTQTATPYFMRAAFFAANAVRAISVGLAPVTAVSIQLVFFVCSNKLSNTLYQALISSGSDDFSRRMVFLYSNLINKFSNAVGCGAASFHRMVISTQREGYKELTSKLQPQDEELFINWVNTLLKLPQDILPQKEKEAIRYVLGLGHDELLKASDDETLVFVEIDDVRRLEVEYKR